MNNGLLLNAKAWIAKYSEGTMRKFLLLSTVFIVVCFFNLRLAYEDERTPNIEGEWSITINFISGVAHHIALIKVKGDTLSGVYKGQFKEGTLRGLIKKNKVDFTGYLKHQATHITFHYTGTIEGDTMKGTVNMGEYWSAIWTARRVYKREKE